MSIFRQERSITTREELEGYLEAEKGHVPAKVKFLEPTFVEQGADMEQAGYVQVVQKGHFVKTPGDEEDCIVFVPRGERLGDPIVTPDTSPYVIRGQEDLVLNGLNVVVRSRQDLSSSL